MTSPILTHCWGPKPPGWKVHETRADGISWINGKRQLYVIASTMTYDDGREWLHLSVSHRKRLPSYDEMKYLKRHWAGVGTKAIEVHPPEEEHVNIHPRARHLWICLTEDPLPDFTMGTGSI